MVVDEVVEQQSLEVLLPVRAEQEAVDAGAKLLEGEVRGRKDRAAGMGGGVVDEVEEPRLHESQLKRAELAWQEVDHLGDLGWRQEDAVDAVDHAVCAEDVDGDDARVVVYSQAAQTDVGGQTLRVAAELLGWEEGGDCVADENAACWVEVGGDVVCEDLLEEFLRGLGSVLGDLLEGGVGRGEHGVVGCRSVEELHQVGVVVDQGGQLGGVLARGNELVRGAVSFEELGVTA